MIKELLYRIFGHKPTSEEIKRAEDLARLEQTYTDVKEGLAKIPKKMRYGYDPDTGEPICQGYDGVQDPGRWEPETMIGKDGHLWEVGFADTPCVHCAMKYQTYLDKKAYLLYYPNRQDLKEQICCHGVGKNQKVKV
jgi:hypothetical protein